MGSDRRYTRLLAKGDALSPDERQKIIEQMCSLHRIKQGRLSIRRTCASMSPEFTHYLLLDQKLRVGRLDGALHRA